MSNEFRISELGVDVLFNKGKDLRYNSELSLMDLVAEGDRQNIDPIQTIKLIARQLHLYKNKYALSYEKIYDWKGVARIYTKKDKLPFVVAHTALTSIKFGLGEEVNPRPFIDNIALYRPTSAELKQYSEKEINTIANGPALLAGSAILIYWDGIDENRVLLRKRSGGAYDGKLSIPGGHADTPLDAFSLQELSEETGLGLSIIRRARPLGVADQLIFARGTEEKPRLIRFINFVWSIDVIFRDKLDTAEKLGWRMFDEDEIPVDQLTPIARIGIDMSGFPIWNPRKL